MSNPNQNYVPDWPDDVLNRRESARFLTTYLNSLYGDSKADAIYESSYVLCLNADWGFGKTYLIKKWAEDLERDLRHPVIYFDAWRNDFSDDPLLAFISELEISLKDYTSKVPIADEVVKTMVSTAKAAIAPLVKTAANVLIKKVIGTSGEEIYEMVSAASQGVIDNYMDDALESHKRRKSKIKEFSIQLERLLAELVRMKFKLPMYIFIDELDRCKPSYAIELLEGIKHIFGTNGVFFVIATNKFQLGKSIKAIYGAEFDSISYLQRFFNQEYQLPEPDFHQFATLLIEKRYRLNQLQVQKLSNDDDLTKTFAILAQGFTLSLRAQDQAAKQLKSMMLTQALPIIVHHWFLLFLIMFRIKNETVYEELLKKTALDWSVIVTIFNPRMTMLGTSEVPDAIYGHTQAQIGVTDIIREYFRLEFINGLQIYSEQPFSSGTLGSIKQFFLNTDVPRQYQQNVHYPLSISKYRKLIIQAGQLS